MRAFRFLLPVTLGAVSASGFPPWNALPVTLIALAIWLHLVHEAPTLRRVLGIGWWFGVGHFCIANAWIQQPFEFQEAMPHWLGYLAVLLLSLYLAIYPMLAAGLAWRLASPAAKGDPAPAADAAFVLIAGAAWMVTEYLRGTMFTGYPWDPLALVLVPGDYAQAAWLVGTYALSGLIVVLAGALILLVQRRWRLAAVAWPAFALLTLCCNDPCRIATCVPLPASTKLVRVVQPNLPEEERPTTAYAENNFQALAKLSRRADPNAPPRLIFWPEGAMRFPVEDGYPKYVYAYLGSATMARMRMGALLSDQDAILTGTQTIRFDKAEDMVAATNSIVLVRSDARLHGRYDKAHLVPYGEYLPMRPLLEALGLSRLVPGDVDFIPGPGPRTMAVPGFGRVGMLICYEVIFSGATVDPANRPDFLFNPSNDAWFGDLGPPAHLAQAQLRAIEEGLPVIRATPTGISAIIAADGRILASVPMHRTGAIETPIPPRFAPTPFSLIGNWMVALVGGLLTLIAIAIRRRHG
ncbi:apolipoprotein N-acyltransferase [Sphingomonas panacisoli]|uniref:Apolipoprotein N-acyltransferase n=1 Tax=Sphingomonas panacisoli TaxID=1813879 RepID=A0A5B8LIY4_9SPHN|nr:apolipoprotein N-acyltransferase [Sphingomonas panacisoli]QDZ08178.1 apolipoprotein N-acyltransferase [Sphingomonas panacisoli]